MHPFVSMPKREYSKADEALMDLQYVRHHICLHTVGRGNHLIIRQRAQLLLIGPTSPSAFNDAERTQMSTYAPPQVHCAA